MTNHTGLGQAAFSWSLAACAFGLLGGCVAAVIPVAAGGLIGRSAAHRRTHSKSAPVTAPTRNPSSMPTSVVGMPAGAPAIVPHESPVDSVLVDPATSPTVRKNASPPPPATPLPTARATTTWDDVVQYMAKLVLLPPERSRSSVLRSPNEEAHAPCTSTPSAVIVNAATLGPTAYVDLGAIHTMGYEIVFTSTAPSLPAAQVLALAKTGIAAPIRRQTLFLSPPGGEKTARIAIAARYCVVGIAGDRAADFPYSITPGSREAHAGWFLIAKPER